MLGRIRDEREFLGEFDGLAPEDRERAIQLALVGQPLRPRPGALAQAAQRALNNIRRVRDFANLFQNING